MNTPPGQTSGAQVPALSVDLRGATSLSKQDRIKWSRCRATCMGRHEEFMMLVNDCSLVVLSLHAVDIGRRRTTCCQKAGLHSAPHTGRHLACGRMQLRLLAGKQWSSTGVRAADVAAARLHLHRFVCGTFKRRHLAQPFGTSFDVALFLL